MLQAVFPRIAATLLLLVVCALAQITQAADLPNFNGIWQLDKAKSTNLPGVFQTVDEYLLIIKQADDKSITVSTEFHGRGQTITSEPDSYPIDGTAKEKEDPRGFKLKRSFKYGEGKVLIVETDKIFKSDLQMPNTSENESWQLSEEGKILTVTITPKAEGSSKQVRVFAKKTQDGN